MVRKLQRNIPNTYSQYIIWKSITKDVPAHFKVTWTPFNQVPRKMIDRLFVLWALSDHWYKWRNIYNFYDFKQCFLSFSCYLAAPQWTLGCQGGSLTNLMNITVSFLVNQVTGNPVSKVGSQSLAKHLVRFEPGSCQFSVQCLDSLDHYPLGVKDKLF